MPNLLPLNLQLITHNTNRYQKFYHNLNIQHELVEDVNEKQAEKILYPLTVIPPNVTSKIHMQNL
jgi:hypothetical protein